MKNEIIMKFSIFFMLLRQHVNDLNANEKEAMVEGLKAAISILEGSEK